MRGQPKSFDWRVTLKKKKIKKEKNQKNEDQIEKGTP
jgi:hypothetical protein